MRSIVVLAAAALLVQPPTTTHERPPVWNIQGDSHGAPAADLATAYFLDAHHQVVAIDIATARIVWKSATGEPGRSTLGNTIRVAEDLVVAGVYNVIAFDRASGERRWRFEPREGYGPGYF